jgi:hypothetical protein
VAGGRSLVLSVFDGRTTEIRVTAIPGWAGGGVGVGLKVGHSLNEPGSTRAGYGHSRPFLYLIQIEGPVRNSLQLIIGCF